VARDATLRVTFDDFPDPDAAVFGPILLRSGKGNFDADIRVSLVDRAILVRPRTPMAPSTTYQLVITTPVQALDGRRLASDVIFPVDVGGTLANLPAPPPVTWAGVVPWLQGDRCAGCHPSTGGDRQLDLAGDPDDPIYGIINVPMVGLAGTDQQILRVQPGNSARSGVLRKLLGGGTQPEPDDLPYPPIRVDGKPMPLDGNHNFTTPMPDDAVRLIQQWIDDGAGTD
jgi:hypothetical protein